MGHIPLSRRRGGGSAYLGLAVTHMPARQQHPDGQEMVLRPLQDTHELLQVRCCGVLILLEEYG